jgi:flagellar basal body rod protein FlgG
MDALRITEAGLLNDVERLRVLSHNLANATTPGFRRDVAVFRPFDIHLEEAGLRATGSTRASATDVDRTPGATRYSGNPLDVALEGDGFFVLQSQTGTVFSRQGSFQLDSQGRLAGPNGSTVLGASGEIMLSGPEPRIDQTGNVWERDKLVGTLKVVRFPADAQLVPLGGGQYAADAANVQDVEAPRIRQGYVEASNVTPMREMVRLIETIRHFEASQRLVRGYDDMMDRALSLLGEA